MCHEHCSEKQRSPPIQNRKHGFVTNNFNAEREEGRIQKLEAGSHTQMLIFQIFHNNCLESSLLFLISVSRDLCILVCFSENQLEVLPIAIMYLFSIVLIWALVFLFDSTLWVYSVTHYLSPNIDSQCINFVGFLLANGSV